MLARPILAGNVERATEIVNAPHVRTVSAVQVDDAFVGDETRVVGQILRIKKAGQSTRKKTRVHTSLSLSLSLSLTHTHTHTHTPYTQARTYSAVFRLTMLSQGDTKDGSLFYIYCRNETKAIGLFLMRDLPWVGQKVCVFEPEFEFKVANIPALSTEQPLLPLNDQVFGDQSMPATPEWLTGSEMRAVYVRNADLQVSRVNVVEVCGAKMCDGQHEVTERCPALTQSCPKKQILRGLFSSTAAGIKKAHFQSFRWTKFIMDEDCTKITARDDINNVDVRTSCQQVLDNYAENNIGWTICGWIKPGVALGAEVGKEPKIHMCYVAPDRVLPNAPIYRRPQPPRQPEDPLVLAYPRPAIALNRNAGGAGANGNGRNGEGGNGEGGNREGGDREGGDREGGDREGGDREGGNQEGGNGQ
ncbi:hypothetical protein ScPMuIL_010506 [Solemya velum]